MPKTKHTKTEQRNIVNRAFALVRSGHSITNARKVIADEIGVSPNTLFVWQHSFNMKTPTVIKTANLVRSNGLRKSTKVVTKSNEYANVHEMARDTGRVMKSLVNQDGRFTTKEASAISGLFNGHISLVKLRLEASKISTKSNTVITNDVLTLQ